MSSEEEQTPQLILVRSLEELERHLSVPRLAAHLRSWLEPWHDPLPEIERGIRDALTPGGPLHGFAALAIDAAAKPLGALVMLSTGMQGYIPGHLLLYIAVDPSTRGQGLGGRLIDAACAECPHGVKLHVEIDNPAGHLYERKGFTQKYREMRWEPRTGQGEQA